MIIGAPRNHPARPSEEALSNGSISAAEQDANRESASLPRSEAGDAATLVSLDESDFDEQILPYTSALAQSADVAQRIEMDESIRVHRMAVCMLSQAPPDMRALPTLKRLIAEEEAKSQEYIPMRASCG